MNHNKLLYTRFYLVGIVSALFPVLAIASFNFFVDPYGIWNSPKFWGVNQYKPAQKSHVRLFKAVNITRIKPTIVILGSSRTDYGIDPTHSALSGGNAYNLATHGSNMYELRRYLSHVIANQPDLELVILGVDFLMFNKSLDRADDFEEHRLEKRRITVKDTLATLFSLDTFETSQLTRESNKTDPDRLVYYPQGMRHPQYHPCSLKNTPRKLCFKWHILAYLKTDFLYKNYQLSEEYLQDFQTIVDICKERGITLKVFISPIHATQLEAIQIAGIWQFFEQWKRELVKITPIWDFSDYNSITTETLGDEMKYYHDQSHYRKEVGDLLLNRIFSFEEEKVPADFGVAIAPENIESHLKKIRVERENWVKNHPSEMKLLEEIAEIAIGDNAL